VGGSDAAAARAPHASPLGKTRDPLTTHSASPPAPGQALGAADDADAKGEPAALRLLRNLDLVVFLVALPLFLLAGLPMLGWGGAAAAWLVQRAIRAALERRARAADDPRSVAGLLVASMLTRGWLVALSIFGVGLVENDAGLAAAVLVLSAFTLQLSARMALRPFDTGAGGP
jgi:hypothetical protein